MSFFIIKKLVCGGGAVGVIIVEDPDGYLPAVYASMIEKILFLSLHNLNTLSTIATSAQSTPLANAATVAAAQTQDANVFLVNGQKDASMGMVSHLWHRFAWSTQQWSSSLICRLLLQPTALLANGSCWPRTEFISQTDPEIPRTIAEVILFPGARADVAVSCTCTTCPCTASLSSAASRRSSRHPWPGHRQDAQTSMYIPGPWARHLLQKGGPGAAGTDVVTGTFLTLAVSETSGGAVAALPTTVLTRPCYLVDLRSTAPTTIGALNLGGGLGQLGQRVVQWNGAGTSMTYANVHAC